MMEQIQLAGMMADLAALDAAEKKAATDLVRANKTVDAPPTSSPDDAKPGTSAPRQPTTHSTAQNTHDRLEFLCRHFPLSRSQSATNSMPGTPQNESAHDDEVDRARNIMLLADLRAKIRDSDQTSLVRAREKMQALVARQQHQHQHQHHQHQYQYQHQHQQQKPSHDRAVSTSLFSFPKADK